MAEQHRVPHPRKLYTQLRDAPSAQQRERAALDFLCSSSGAAGGYLFLSRASGLQLALGADARKPSPELIAEASRAWARELDTQSDNGTVKTIDMDLLELVRDQPDETWLWRSPENDQYERRVLGVYRGGQWEPVGLVMLQVASDGRPLASWRQVHVDALCNALLDAVS